VKVRVIETNEDLMIVQHVSSLLGWTTAKHPEDAMFIFDPKLSTASIFRPSFSEISRHWTSHARIARQNAPLLAGSQLPDCRQIYLQENQCCAKLCASSTSSPALGTGEHQPD